MTKQSGGNPTVDHDVDWSQELARHDRWLRTVIATRCGEPQAVDEIMQEVALAVIKQQAPLRDEQKVAPWLYQVAVRQSLMYRRKHGRRRKHEQQYARRVEAEPREQSLPPTPLQWLLADERRKLIRKSLDRLKPKDAEILMLKYTEDWSYGDIAGHLGITPSAVESRLHRARQRLRQEIASHDLIEAKP